MIRHSLADLGWSDHFSTAAAGLPGTPARLTDIHRSRAEALSEAGPLFLTARDMSALAVGDWVLHDRGRVLHRLAPKSTIARRAAGQIRLQAIASNIDTMGIVSSCNAEFNPARLERYLALAEGSDVLPLIILTKADLAEAPRFYERAAMRLSPLVSALSLDATDPHEADRLTPWLTGGQTLALVGSSGVGKTTLRNALTGGAEATRAIREDDARGRHTTTARSLVATLAGGWLIDTPGMRELGLAGASDGIDRVFAEITELAEDCRFNDCAHETEPGCAVRAAMEAGRLDADRLIRWRKLQREDRYNSETIAERHQRERAFAKVVKGAVSTARQKRGR